MNFHTIIHDHQKYELENNFHEILKEAVCCAITLFYVIYHIKSSDIENVQSNIFLYVPASPASAKKKSEALLSQRDVVKPKKSFKIQSCGYVLQSKSKRLNNKKSEFAN